MSARWNSLDLAQKQPATPRKAPAPPKEPPAQPGALRSGETAQSGILTTFQEITFPGKVPGLNGAGGLLRMHWSERQLLAGRLEWVVLSQRPAKMPGPVRLELIRYSSGRPMDYDGLVSTGKLPIDALVRCGILPDDNPQVIPERFYTQVRCKPDEQRTTICLTPLQP